MKRTQRKYEKLGETLLTAYDNSKPLKWLAKQTYVSTNSVHLWLTGQTRPRPDHLGQIAALLQLDPAKLAALAEYIEEPSTLEKIEAAYNHCLLRAEMANVD